VSPVATSTAGSLAIVVKPVAQGVRVVSSSRSAAERLVRGYYPGPGTTILAVDGVRVHSQEDLDRAFAGVEPDAWIELVTTDGRWVARIESPPTPKPRRPGAPVVAPTPDDESGGE